MYYFMSKKLVVLMKVAKKYAWGVIQWFRSVNEYLYL